MTLRARIFIIISLAVLFVLGVSVFLIFMSKNKQSSVGTDVNQGVVVGQNNIEQVTSGLNTTSQTQTNGLKVQAQTPEEEIKNGVKQLAKIFVERYNSYSTDSNYQNIREVESLVTADLWKRISNKLNNPQTAKEFYGVTTQSIGANLVSWAVTMAQVEVKTLQTETKGSLVFTGNKNFLVYMVQKDNNWLVEKFEIK